jgi:uncharacterized Zn-binding protein involved in type VI secretion
MARKVYDRVKEYTASTGIGGISFIGAFTGFQSFDSVFTSGDTTFYVIEEHNQWEVGIGTYGSHNLERDTVLSSSNNGSKINLTGSGVVSVTYPASQVFFADDVVDVSGVAYYASGQAVINQDDIVAVSGLIGTADFLPGGSGALIDQNTDQISSVSGWADSTFLKVDDDTYVSGIASYASGQAVLNQGDIASVSGLIGDADFLPGATGALIDQNIQQIASVSGWSQVYADNGDAAVSGWAQSGLDGLDNDLSSVSGWTQSGLDYLTSDLASVSGWTTDNFNTTNSDVDYVSGVASYASGQAIQNESDIVAVSGLIGVADFLPGATGALIDQNTDDIATASGALRNSINTNAADIVTASGSLRDSVNANTADIATASGALRDSINENILDIASVSGLLTPSGTDFTFSNATLTYFNSDGGSFDVDLSSISGDVYAMIVDGAPVTLDTLNEIAAALNDDANLANTLTNLITSTSGNLQSQITDNVNNLSSTSGYFETRVDGADAEILAVSGWSDSTFSTLLQMEYVSGIATYASGKSVTGTPSGVLFFDDAGSVTGNSSFIFDGANVTLDGYIDASGERVVTSPDIHHLVQLTQAEYDAITPDSATFYIITDAPSVSGYFEPKVSQNETDIVAVSGIAAYASGNSISGNPSGILFFDDTGAVTGNNSLIFDGQSITLDGTIFATGERVITSDEIFHIKQLTQAEYDTLTPDSSTFYIITDASEDAAISGYFESRADNADTNITAVSGIAAYASGNTITGTPSGILFFDNSGSVSGSNTLIYDGVDVALSGNITASGKRVISSDEIYHIKQLTQAEYDAITPDAATFYIITDPDIEGPVVQPYREVSSNTTILTSDYTINATAGAVLTLPTAVGNGGLMFNIKNTSTGNVIVSGVAGETLDGDTSFEISTQYQSIKVQSTNSNWVIL